MIPKPKRLKNRDLLDEVKTNPCIICGKPTDPCHIKTRGSGGDDVASNVIPMCRAHHTEQGALGWDTFIKRYPSIDKPLRDRGWKIVNQFGIRKLRQFKTRKIHFDSGLTRPYCQTPIPIYFKMKTSTDWNEVTCERCISYHAHLEGKG